ncbi:MAG: helix-turn-helix domain-containing protein [Ruminococcaceae bacterium]|nr:helix-turn-helix domain-containing protein [Oscillospiraceae bacterium]
MQLYTYLDKKQHGTLEFPVEYYLVDVHHPQYRMNFHWHKEWELLRVVVGTFAVTLEDKQYILQAGDVLLIPGETLHGGEPQGCVYECLVFDLYGLFYKLEAVKTWLRPFYRKEYLPQTLFAADDPSSAVHTMVDTLMGAGTQAGYELTILSELGRLFAYIIRSQLYSVQGADEGHGSERLKPVLEYIDRHYAQTVRLEDLARVAGMSPKYFCRVFRAMTHYTPMNYVNIYRIEQAAYLLDTTDLSITEVGTRCGFWESSHFTKVFKQYKHITPRQYRAEKR